MPSHSSIKTPSSAARISPSSSSLSSSNMPQSAPSSSRKLTAYTTRSRKRVSKVPPSSAVLSKKLKLQRLRHRSGALENVQISSPGSSGSPRVNWSVEDALGEPNTSIPVFAGVTLPRQLARTLFREPRPQALAAIDPSLVHTNIEYVKDCMELRGSDMFNTLKRTSVLALNRPHGPKCLPVSARVQVSKAYGDLPTHVLAIRSSLSGNRDMAQGDEGTSDSTTPAVAQYTAVHALVLAIYAPLLGALPPSDPSSQLPDSWAPGDDVELTLPVVVLRVPSPSTFGLLLAVLYSQRFDNFVKTLLGIPLIAPDPSKPQSQSSLFTQSLFSSLLSPLSELPPSPSKNESDTESENEVDLARDSENLSKEPTEAELASSRASCLTKRISSVSHLLALGYTRSSPASDPVAAAHTLIRRARLVQALTANARALGACDLALWGAIDVAWAVLLGAIGVCAGGLSPTTMGVAGPLLHAGAKML